MKHIFVINPVAGKKKWHRLEEKIHAAAEKLQIDYGFCMAMELEELPTVLKNEAEKAGGPVRFYACGGDGTLCRVMNAMIGIEHAEIALFPAGTGNDFSRNFLHREFFGDLERQIRGKAERIDTIVCNGIHSINMINIGFDCNVVAKTEKVKKRTPFNGSFAYLIGLMITFFQKFGTKMALTFPDGRTADREFTLAAIGNGGFCGGGFHSNPYSVLNDGLLDLCIINKVTRRTFLRLVSSYKKGCHMTRPASKGVIFYEQLPSLHISFEKPTGICIDGEIVTADHADLCIAPRSVAFSIPDGCTPLNPLVTP